MDIEKRANTGDKFTFHGVMVELNVFKGERVWMLDYSNDDHIKDIFNDPRSLNMRTWPDLEAFINSVRLAVWGE